jgi:hypothetical protein
VFLDASLALGSRQFCRHWRSGDSKKSRKTSKERKTVVGAGKTACQAGVTGSICGTKVVKPAADCGRRAGRVTAIEVAVEGGDKQITRHGVLLKKSSAALNAAQGQR